MRIPHSALGSIVAICAVSVLARPCTGQDTRRVGGTPPGIHFHAGRSARNIPFRLELGHLVLPVRVADSMLIDMTLDTGLGVNGAVLLDPAIGESLGLHYSGQVPLGGGGTSSPVKAHVAPDIVLSLPGVTFAGQTLLVVTDTQPYRNFPTRGIIGKTVFGCAVEIDYEDSLLHLYDASSYRPPDGCTSLRSEFSYGIPVVEATISTDGATDVPVRLLVDTGAVQLLLFTWARPGIGVPSALITGRARTLARGFNGTVLGSTGRIERIDLGPYTLRQVVTSFPDSAAWGSALVLGQDGMLGNDGLCRFFVAFDYAHERIHLRPNASFDEPFETDMSGMLWEPTPEGSVEVVDVIPNSPAAESGLEAGDLILAVDGRQVRELGATALGKLLLREGLQLRLTVERGTDRSERNLVTRRLI